MVNVLWDTAANDQARDALEGRANGFMKFIHLIALLLGFALASCAPASAQSGTSSALAGTVSDSSGALVANADVSAVNVDTRPVRKAQPDPPGRSLSTKTPPGNYQGGVSATGFPVKPSKATPVAVGRTV